NAVLFAYVDSAAFSVAQQHLVEPRALHLKRLWRRRFDGGREIRILLDVTIGLAEARAPLLHEASRRDRLLYAERAEDFVAPWKLRLADVKARKALALQQDHFPATAHQRGRGARSTRAAADDRYVEIPIDVRHAKASLRRKTCGRIPGGTGDDSALL